MAPGPVSDPAQVTADPTKVMAFAERFVADTSAAALGTMCALGNRLGLFRDLMLHGPATSMELAERTGLHERCVREWLLALASAGYLELDRDGRKFVLPPAHAAVLADEDGAFHMGDLARLIPELSAMLNKVVDAFRHGTGVPAEEYPTGFYETMWRKDASRLKSVLVPQWIPAVEGLSERLARGGTVAQLGCGDGRALILLAQAFPSVHCVGYDPVEFNLARARAEAASAGVDSRIEFRHKDPATDLDSDLALVIALDVLHDAPDPAALLRRVRTCLGSDGVFLLLETNGADTPAAAPGPVSALLYGISTLYSVPQGVAAGTDVVGMMGLPSKVLLPMCRNAGFAVARPIQEPSPFNTLYELRP